MTSIYLDHNATTPVDPEVLEAMLPYLRGEFGNPSSAYDLGRRAHDAIEKARVQVAGLIGATPDEIVFMGSATEATNIAVRGGAATGSRSGIVTTNIEHPATDACCSLLQRAGHSVRRMAPDGNGIVPAARLAEAIDDRTAVVTVIHAQNEIGTIQPVRDVARFAREHGALIHTDAAQSVGKIPVDVEDLGVDLLTIAGHKLCAPKGVGALYVRANVRLPPLIVGAGQERGLRAGTENVAFVVGLGAACALAKRVLDSSRRRMSELSAMLFELLERTVPGLALVGDREQRLPNTLNVLFPGISGRELLEACPSVLASTGSACHAGSEEPSAILTALGLPQEKARGAVRLSLGRATTADDVVAAAASLGAAWHDLRHAATRAAE
jgi:cysteine desulfurase